MLNRRVEGEAEPIGVTDNHPIWSVTREEFVPAGELRVGEELRTLHGTAKLTTITPRGPPEPVYNLEVHSEHVYQVSASGMLVHNACPKPWKNKIHGKPQSTGGPGHRYRSLKEAVRAAKDPSVARVHLNQGYNQALDLPPGTISPNRRPDVTVIYNDGRVGRIEVESPSDSRSWLHQRNTDLNSQIQGQGFNPLLPDIIR